MCTIVHHISSYIKGILFLAVMVLNLGMHQVRAEIYPEDFLDPNNPYKISSGEVFAEVFNVLNSEIDYLSSVTWKDTFCISLENDIDMEGIDFVPLMSSDKSLAVKFYGNGHTVKNLSFTGYNGPYSGLFPILENGSVIKDINFENIDVTLPSGSSDS